MIRLQPRSTHTDTLLTSTTLFRSEDIRDNPALNGNVIDGALKNLSPDRPVVALGARLAEALGATVGSSISLISPQGQVTPFGTAPRIVAYEVEIGRASGRERVCQYV